ncbi:MAG: cadherin domain-containing protein, partial [Candidatus Poribacteria bacterium]|nr:cadherin domain-containing protein [Candidatus Poribacteria bacterium]
NSVSDVSPLENLTELIRLYLNDNSVSDVSPLENLTLLQELLLSGNPISDYAPIRTLKTAIENAENSIDIDIDMTNNPPVFTDGDSTTRSVAENTEAGQNIGTAVGATDADSDTLTYSLGGTDADAFDIVSTSGQLQTKAALDYETQTSYTVTVTAYDGNSGGDRITVTIDVTDVVDDNAPAAPSVETSALIPDNTALLTNFPNPFNPETWIPYQLVEPAEVTLTIYDVRGVVVRELKLGHQAAGFYQTRSQAIYWDGRNGIGERVASGLYFYTFTAGDFTATRKLLIRK